jgi:hypothetical protein
MGAENRNPSGHKRVPSVGQTKVENVKVSDRLETGSALEER